MQFKRKNKLANGASTIKSRKELRKQYRKEKKAKKNEFFQKRNLYSEDVSGSVDVKTKGKQASGSEKHALAKSQRCESERQETVEKVSLCEQQQIVRNRKKQQEERRNKQYQKKRVQQLKAANEEEERVIKKLEKQLKLNKRKQKTVPKSFASDGLDYLLEVCDEDGRQVAISTENNFLDNSDSEFEEDLALATGKIVKRTTSESVSETDEDVRSSVDCGQSIGSSGSEDNNSGDESCYSDIDRHTGALVSGRHKKLRVDNRSHQLEKENNKFVSRGFDCQKDLGDSESIQISSNQENIKKSKAIKTKCQEVTSSQKLRTQEGKEFKTLDVSVSEWNDSDTAVVNPKRIKKRKLKSSNDIDDGADMTVIKHKKKKVSKIMRQDSNTKEQITRNPEKKKMGIQKKTVTFEDELFSHDEDSEDEGEENDTKEVWEDIYGRTRDKKGNIIRMDTLGKYVPPHLRVQMTDDDAKKQAQLSRLRKQVKGLLNRLAESNMNVIAVQLDELYMSNSRNNMNETLTLLVLESIVASVLTPVRLVMEHVMLIAILHANVGSEVGAHFLQVVVKKFELLNSQFQEVENKELDNIVLTLSHLYNFKVFHCILMFDILEKLVEKFGEKEIELILIVLRNVGFSLRKDDPSALKNFILRVQQKASANTHSDSSRVQFMLDTLLAIKNNNMSKIPNYDTSHSEHLKKLLKSFLRKGNYVTEMKISLDDLLKAEERGRWWVVGSAWTGVLPGEVQSEQQPSAGVSTQPTTQYSKMLLQLARKQRMNTDIRRNIFCIMMMAEDYLDAFEKLLRLGLKNQQEREIVYVLLHCCLQEKDFNLYYGFLAQKFCDFDRKYQMTFQFSLWDKFREMCSFNEQQITNLAKLLAHLLLERGLPISVLKVVEFVNVDKGMVRFLRQTLLGVLLSPSEDSSLQVFQNVAQSAKLRMFRESLRLFIHHFLLRNCAALPAQDAQLLTRRAKLVDTLLSTSDYKLDLYKDFQ